MNKWDRIFKDFSPSREIQPQEGWKIELDFDKMLYRSYFKPQANGDDFTLHERGRLDVMYHSRMWFHMSSNHRKWHAWGPRVSSSIEELWRKRAFLEAVEAVCD